MPNLPYATRLADLQADITYFEREIAQGRSTSGMRGHLRQLHRKLAWYQRRTEHTPAGAPRFYQLGPIRSARQVSAVPPDLLG